jgi:FAD/FMN-containing dehydrogenase
MNDIVINKIQNIQRCVRRAREEYQADPDGFATNYTRQDAALLNVLRTCETAIDLANYVIRANKLGIPVSSAGDDHLSVRRGGGAGQIRPDAL